VESDERKYTTYSEALFQGMNKNDIRDLSISVHQRAFDRAYRRISALAKAEKPSFAQALQKFLGLKS
jgi:hypothetical protein